jgi:branched-subunit amino acid aminotransferase/4-amino-4-deoxychorismate lyase
VAAQLAESCVLNVALVMADGTLCTPRFENILAGLTVQRIMELAQVRRW